MDAPTAGYLPAIPSNGAQYGVPAHGSSAGRSGVRTAGIRPPRALAGIAVRGLVVMVGLTVALVGGAAPAFARAGSLPGGDATQTIAAVEQGLRTVFAATAFSAIGTLVFVRTVWDGSSRELAFLCRLIERAALVAAVVAVALVGARAALVAGGWSGAPAALPTVLAGRYGSGMLLRAGGAALLSAGASLMRRTPTATLPATIGAALVVGSYALAGFAAGSEPQVVSVVAIVVHVSAVAAWGGGLLALVLTLLHRRRTGRPLRAGYVAARFSVVATYGVALATIAGVALAFVRLQSVSALWATPYGLTLVAKVVLVAAVAGIGAYNHYVVVPVLRVTPDHAIGTRLRWLGYVEVALFVVVIGVNSSLVGLGS